MRLRLLIEYDGGAFRGWQRQPGRATVQGAVEHALSVALGAPTAIYGSGRTDAGVHATGQVAHADVPDGVDAARADPFRLQAALNGLLPDAVAILEVAAAPDAFHARFDARRRTYRYRIATAPRALDRHVRALVRPSPDLELMNAAAAALLGAHDYSSFCRTQSETTNRVCDVGHAAWAPDDRPGDATFEIAATRFLHGMVRAIVGTLVEIGHGKRPPDALPGVLAARDRRAAGPAAPAHGLCLHHVAYDGTAPDPAPARDFPPPSRV